MRRAQKAESKKMGIGPIVHRSDSLERRSKLIDHDRFGRAPVGITEHAESLYLKPVHGDGRQAGNLV